MEVPLLSLNTIFQYHMDQLLVAAHKSLYNSNYHKMKTKSIFTELLYNLYPSRSIREALKNFGTQDDGTTAIFVVFSGGDGKSSNGLENRVQGRAMPMDRIAELRDVAAIKKLYKIPNEISDEEIILDSLLTKMSAKELIL